MSIKRLTSKIGLVAAGAARVAISYPALSSFTQLREDQRNNKMSTEEIVISLEVNMSKAASEFKKLTEEMVKLSWATKRVKKAMSPKIYRRHKKTHKGFY